LIAQTTTLCQILLVALLERDAYNYIGSGEKDCRGPINKWTRDELRKRKGNKRKSSKPGRLRVY
jgi:hypothetical protein